MKVNDLRIGNWIKYEDKLVQVVQLSSFEKQTILSYKTGRE